MGMKPDSINCIIAESLPATAENNPFAAYLPEWKYPDRGAA